MKIQNFRQGAALSLIWRFQSGTNAIKSTPPQATKNCPFDLLSSLSQTKPPVVAFLQQEVNYNCLNFSMQLRRTRQSIVNGLFDDLAGIGRPRNDINVNYLGIDHVFQDAFGGGTAPIAMLK